MLKKKVEPHMYYQLLVFKCEERASRYSADIDVPTGILKHLPAVVEFSDSTTISDSSFLHSYITSGGGVDIIGRLSPGVCFIPYVCGKRCRPRLQLGLTAEV